MLSFCYCAARAANDVPEFRQRIEGDGIVRICPLPPLRTPLRWRTAPIATATLRSDMPFEEYLPRAVQAQQAAQQATLRVEDGEEEAGSLILISTLPWSSYESLIQPVPAPADSNPRLAWGRYYPGRRAHAHAGDSAVPPCPGGRAASRPLLRSAGGTLPRAFVSALFCIKTSFFTPAEPL